MGGLPTLGLHSVPFVLATGVLGYFVPVWPHVARVKKSVGSSWSSPPTATHRFGHFLENRLSCRALLSPLSCMRHGSALYQTKDARRIALYI